MKVLLWIENALTGDYQRQLWYLSTFSFDYCSIESHGEMETTTHWHTYPTDGEIPRGIPREKGEQKTH